MRHGVVLFGSDRGTAQLPDDRYLRTALAGKPDPELLAHWAQIGVTDVAFGLPDRSPDEVVGYLGRLAGRLGLTPAVR